MYFERSPLALERPGAVFVWLCLSPLPGGIVFGRARWHVCGSIIIAAAAAAAVLFLFAVVVELLVLHIKHRSGLRG